MTTMKDSGNPWVREIPSDWFEKKLRYLVELRGEKSVTTDYKKYVGLENIMSQTGQYVQTGIEVDLTENLTFEVGDILFGKLRPYLRKYWRAEFSGTASSEFVIIKGSSLNLNFFNLAEFLTRGRVGWVTVERPGHCPFNRRVGGDIGDG